MNTNLRLALFVAAAGALFLVGCGGGVDYDPNVAMQGSALESDGGAQDAPDAGCTVVVTGTDPATSAGDGTDPQTTGSDPQSDAELSGTGCSSTNAGLGLWPLLLVAAALAFRRRRARQAALFALAVAIPMRANAGVAAHGFSLERFDPAEAGSGFFAADDLSFEGELHPSIGIVTDYANAPLAIRSPSTGAIEPLVARQLIAHFDASFAILNRVRFGASLPLAVMTQGSAGALAGLNYTPQSGFAPGDMRFGADVRVAGRSDGPFRLAVGLRLYVPTGSTDAFMGDGHARAGLRIAAAGGIRWFHYAFEGMAVTRPSASDEPGMPLGGGAQFAAAIAWESKGGAVRIGPEVFAALDRSGDAVVPSASGPAVEALLGAHVRVGSMRFGLGAGPGLTQGIGTPGWRGMASIDWAPPVHEVPPVVDTDGDGIVDSRDACPDVAGEPDPNAARNGCPHPPPDRDRDGIPDAQDACPDEPGPQSSNAAKNGCPLPPPDRDNDGVPDAQDACPDVAGIITGDPKDNGCPPPDRDHDGVPDAEDQCPDKPGLPELDGCPGKDRDGDGVADRLDNCPDQKGPASNQGCPESQPQMVALTKERLALHEPVQFAPRSAELVEGSEKVLDQVAKVLANHPEIVSVVVEGHVDELPSPRANLELSNARAASVVRYLSRHGVARTRLQARGYGSTQPLVSGDRSPGARKENSRIELRFFAVLQ